MTSARAIQVRYRILGVLFVLCFVNYLLRNNFSIAIPNIQKEFGFDNEDIGWILGSFNLSYALLQIPGGIFGQFFGPRRALTWLAVSWGVLTIFTGFAPSLLAASAAGAMTSLIVIRFLLGATNAPLFPVTAGAFANWFPPGRWAFPNSFLSVGLTLGQAVIGPLVTFLIVKYGWRESFYLMSPVGFLIAAWWYWYGRDRPGQHPRITPEEVQLIEGGRGEATAEQKGGWRRMLLNRDMLLLAGAYFCMNYVFYIFANWLVTYLVQARGLPLPESGGWLYSLPFVTGAALAAIGGLVCDALCVRIGPKWGCRLPAVSGMLLVAIFLIAGAYADNPYVAIGLLSLCFGFTQFTEGAFWAASTYIAGPNTTAATGVLNTGGNAAGFLAPLVGWMSIELGWIPTIASGSIFALVSAGLWLMVRIEHKPASGGTSHVA
jgi:ACS family glucarate transporter-like MFS transporter